MLTSSRGMRICAPLDHHKLTHLSVVTSRSMTMFSTTRRHSTPSRSVTLVTTSRRSTSTSPWAVAVRLMVSTSRLLK